MNLRERVQAYLDTHDCAHMTASDIGRAMQADGETAMMQSIRRALRELGHRGDDGATGHDTSDRYAYDGDEYTFTVKGTTFTADCDEVQKWVRWYVAGGGNLTQRAVSRMALQVDERILTRDFIRRIFKVLGIDKGSPGFAPHMLLKHTPEELAKLHFAMAQADAEAAIHASEIEEYKKRYREEVKRRAQGEAMLERIIEHMPSMSISVHVKASKFDDRLEPYTPIVMLSDWHVGALVRVGSHRYDHGVYRQRIRRLRDELDDFFEAYRRPLDELRIAICGDILDGPIGTMRPGQQAEQDLYYEEQCEAAVSGMAEVIAHLRGLVGDVGITVHAVAGNHGRAGGHASEDPRRLPEMLTYRITEEMTKPLDVVWDASSEIIHEWRVYQTQCLQTHGDRAPKGIDKMLRAMLDKSAQTHLLLRGHRHSLEITESHDALGVQCGTIMGETEYGLHQLGLGARPSQSIIEVRRDGPRMPGTLMVG
jgi:predicted phosphodiesterase